MYIYAPSSIDHNILGRKPGERKPLEMVRVPRSGFEIYCDPGDIADKRHAFSVRVQCVRVSVCV